MIKAHVVFATITGNNEDVADIITEGLEDLDVEVTQTEMSQTDASELKSADICVICAYTYDEGSLPEEGLDFFEDLENLDLGGKVFGVAGSGDVYYQEFYNLAVDKFTDQLTKTGAKKGADSLKINLAPEEADIEKLDEFSNQLVTSFKKIK
ncbi:flavodoxin [Apilactobacillus xinyiensis]|uniref:Flavodoxin n=1 Tax=Apilactobacillus xinyiensis TaxID=2841032 RepID=A0ABT0I0C3_9LACO|nr:flavodoxin [Apilactobacillus xinyiensis]MCK8624293.1 flavodoxin [Apilactobacillus xinyiensis]MCL0319175.1 flavodoxin [Apilactobacillus xinyiensis]